MAKRMTDTDKWKKDFIKGLPPEYKLFWVYLTDDCDHAGIWNVTEIETAELRLGIKLSKDRAQGLFKERVVAFDNGAKWFLPDFILFQYGELKESNKVHNSVIKTLSKYNLLKILRGIQAPWQGAKDKDKDTDKDKDKEKDTNPPEQNQFGTFEIVRPPNAPDLQTVKEYFFQQGETFHDGKLAERFFNHHEGIGWRKGITPIMNWRAFANTWCITPPIEPHKPTLLPNGLSQKDSDKIFN